MRMLTTLIFLEDQTSFQDITVKQLLEKPQIDGKEIQITLVQPSFQHLNLQLKKKLIQMPLSEKKEVNMRKLIMPIFPEDQISFQDTTVKQLLEKPQIDGKETQIIPDQQNFQHLSLLHKLKLTLMGLLVLFHKKSINNMTESNNSRNLLTSQMPKILMISRTGTTQTNNQIQELIHKKRVRPKPQKLRQRKHLKLLLLLHLLMLRKLKRKKIRNLILQKYQLLKRNLLMERMI